MPAPLPQPQGTLGPCPQNVRLGPGAQAVSPGPSPAGGEGRGGSERGPITRVACGNTPFNQPRRALPGTRSTRVKERK